MSTVALRSISVLILACWMSPHAAALGLGMHLALEHHHALEHHDDHQDADHHALDLTDLARAATHGHHHDATAADHDHASRLDGSLPAKGPSTSGVAILTTPASAPVLGHAYPLARGPGHDPPVSLFTAHCSLLL